MNDYRIRKPLRALSLFIFWLMTRRYLSLSQPSWPIPRKRNNTCGNCDRIKLSFYTALMVVQVEGNSPAAPLLNHCHVFDLQILRFCSVYGSGLLIINRPPIKIQQLAYHVHLHLLRTRIPK